MVFFWIIVAIIIFSIVVLIHELGHFSAARKFWVKVEEFWLWIPPRAKTLFTDKYWTKYTLNWLPLWGFVKLTWEQPNTFLIYDENKKLLNNEEIEKKIKNNKEIYYQNWEKIKEKEKNEILNKIKENKAPYNLMNKPAWQQAIIILAWVFMNFLLASIIFSTLFFIWIKPLWINTQIPTNLELKLIPTYSQAINNGLLIKKAGVLLNPIENSIAQKSGLKENDILLKINNTSINSPQKAIEIIKNNPWKTLTFTIKRDNKVINLNIIPDKKTSKIWAYIGDNIELNKDFKYKYWLLNSIKYWILETYNQSLLTLKWIGILIKKIINPQKPEERQEALNQMSWPIWIVDFISNSLSNWFIFLLVITAIISINLWVFNLLPIPALDGWRFIFIVINWLLIKVFWRKIISTNTENIIHVIFFIILIALSLLIWYNDIDKILSK